MPPGMIFLLPHGPSSILHGNNHFPPKYIDLGQKDEKPADNASSPRDWKDLTFHFFPIPNSLLAFEALRLKAVWPAPEAA